MLSNEQLTEWAEITASGELCDFDDGVYTVLSQLIAEVLRLRARVKEMEENDAE